MPFDGSEFSSDLNSEPRFFRSGNLLKAASDMPLFVDTIVMALLRGFGTAYLEGVAAYYVTVPWLRPFSATLTRLIHAIPAIRWRTV